MFAPSGLDAGLFVGGEYVITWPQCGATPTALVEIENTAGLASELRIAWEDPGAMPPGAQRILAEPAPERGTADLCDDAARHRLLAQFADGPAGKWQAPAGRQLTRQRLDRDDDTGGKSVPDAHIVEVPQGQRDAHCENADATC